MSVRSRLTLLATAAVTLALVAGALSLVAVVSRQRIGVLDQIVTTRVSEVAALVDAGRLPPVLPVVEPGEVAQVLDADGAVIASSATGSQTLPVLTPSELAELRRDAGGAIVVSTSQQAAYGGDARVAVSAATYDGRPVSVVASMPLGEVSGLVDALRVSLFGVVPVLAGAFGVVVWYLMGAALAPVEQLRTAAEQIAREGGPGELPVGARTDELHRLARTLNEMLDRLEASAARQRVFVADAAHELRSPIAALRAAVEVAQAHPGTTTVVELASDLDGELRRLQRLVDDLLVLARLGSTSRASGPVDLGEVVAAAVAQVPRRDAVTTTVTGQGRASGDSDDLTRVVRNLVENAVRHASTSVMVQVAPGVVSVKDDGPGIPVADRDRVFERFVRLDDARQRDAGGSGLGLAIARELARDAGGDVQIDETDTGLAVMVTVPLVEAP